MLKNGFILQLMVHTWEKTHRHATYFPFFRQRFAWHSMVSTLQVCFLHLRFKFALYKSMISARSKQVRVAVCGGCSNKCVQGSSVWGLLQQVRARQQCVGVAQTSVCKAAVILNFTWFVLPASPQTLQLPLHLSSNTQVLL